MKKAKSSKKLTHLCSELKDHLDALDQMEDKGVKEQGPTPAQKRKILFRELKEKLDSVS